MKKITLLALAILGAYFVCSHILKSKVDSEPNSVATIKELKNHPSKFVDSSIVLMNLYVNNAQSVLNYTRSQVSDEAGQEIILLSYHPYVNGQKIDRVKGKYILVYADNKKQYGLLISNDLTQFTDLKKLLRALVF